MTMLLCALGAIKEGYGLFQRQGLRPAKAYDVNVARMS